ncbi:hypothetical protein GXP70_08340 [Paenibacillus lycopersici]|uniref:O-antigen ligase-related domain-containing protein n=1 Tax=Paenibacillus lycopersici TaxID=2704462 RepID=A0A6C0FWV8_9BACL|nr:O-antigen ligase family protein [Paenibacillus lycopersici]QHT59961.1 hypothetical protein GXP70_08340 [Paenibacillus lycopersici]
MLRRIRLGLGTLLTAAALTGAAFRYGMFFDEAFYRWEGLICLSALLVIGMRVVRARTLARRGRMQAGQMQGQGQMQEQEQGQEQEQMQEQMQMQMQGQMQGRVQEGNSPSFLLVLGLLLIALLYGAALLVHPASVLGSLQQTLRYCAFAGFALLLQVSFAAPDRRAWLSAALQASGLAVAGCALAGWMGALSFPSMVMTSGDARLTAVGARLAGFVQYPNFLGAVAAAYLLWSWLLLLRARSLAGFALVSAGAVPYLLVMLLTESRGAWAAAALAWLAGCLLLKGRKRCAWLLYGGWTLVCGSAACRAVIGAWPHAAAGGTGAEAAVAAALPMLAVFCAAPVGLLGMRAWIGRCRERLLPGLSIAAWLAAVVGMTQLLPPAVYGRLGGGGASYATAATRGLYYRDAWKLIREAPLLGRGGDAWRSLFKEVQSQPYVGNEVHSGLLELVLDLGLIGLLAAMLVLAAALIPVWKRERTGLLPIGVLLLHALIDFDLSFGYDWLLIVSWLVYYASGEPAGDSVGGIRAGASGGGSSRGRVMMAAVAERSSRAARRIADGRSWRAALMAAAAGCFAAAAILGWRFDAAVRHRETAAAASGAARTAALRAALEANPYWTRIRLELAALAPPPERAALLAAGLRDEPQSVPLMWALGRESAERGDVRGAAGWMRRALERDRFDRAKQTEAVVTMARLAQTMRAGDRREEAWLAADEADAFYAAYEALADRHAPGGRRFTMTAEAEAAAEQCRRLAVRLSLDQAQAQAQPNKPPGGIGDSAD